MSETVKQSQATSKLDIYPSLPRFEIFVYSLTWIGLYLFAVKQVFHLSKDYTRKGLQIGDLVAKDDYFTSSRPLKDMGDFEWDLWVYWFKEMVVYGNIGHFIIMRICELINPKYRFHVSMLYTFLFCIYYYQLQGLLLLISQSVICFTIAYFTESVIFTWISSMLLILPLISSVSAEYLNHLFDDQYAMVTFICSSTMCNLRYIAFCLEYCWSVNQSKADKNLSKKDVPDSKKKSKTDRKTDLDDAALSKSLYQHIVDLLLYQFYFPLFSGGPVLNYNKFAEQIQMPPAVWNVKFIFEYAAGIFRYCFWQVAINFLLHFFYFASIHSDERLMNKTPLLTLCGLGLCFVQFFSMKYMVIYGLPSRIARADNLDVPGASHCVSAKHKFTDMWKYFDRGLHFWLLRYIFIPLGGSRYGFLRNTVNSLLPFAFVYLWHGYHNSHLVWAAFNWFGVYVEKIANDIYKMERIQVLEAKYLSPANSRRLRAVLSTPLFSFLIISNLYFLAGITAGNIYIKRIYTEDLFSTIIIHTVLYLGAQTSMELSRYGM